MPICLLEEMQQDSMESASQALEKYNIEQDIAAHIKKGLTRCTTPPGILGRNFSSYITRKTKHFICFY
ncbi:dynein light chain 1, cytoplasmic-like [Molossus molossus]|uniref:dynein light chain 1, cytoplasmic-like n=1 Tax=Molossus molossus TaxID=27622 RepID=UPI0017478A49|nr:dynein light chain 1, cytoplasmic-like [Molossus molossus]